MGGVESRVTPVITPFPSRERLDGAGTPPTEDEKGVRVFVRKDKAGSTHLATWDRDGAVVEVPDWHGEELLRIPGFTQVGPEEAPKPKPAPPQKTKQGRVFDEVNHHGQE